MQWYNLQWTMRALDNKQDEDVELPQRKSHKKQSIWNKCKSPKKPKPFATCSIRYTKIVPTPIYDTNIVWTHHLENSACNKRWYTLLNFTLWAFNFVCLMNGTHFSAFKLFAFLFYFLQIFLGKMMFWIHNTKILGAWNICFLKLELHFF